MFWHKAALHVVVSCPWDAESFLELACQLSFFISFFKKDTSLHYNLNFLFSLKTGVGLKLAFQHAWNMWVKFHSNISRFWIYSGCSVMWLHCKWINEQNVNCLSERPQFTQPIWNVSLKCTAFPPNLISNISKSRSLNCPADLASIYWKLFVTPRWN